MFGSTTSESLEAIDFFTTAYQFGVPHTQSGIDAMLTLIYSSDSNIKSAMMNSYKQIYLTVEETNDPATRALTVRIYLFAPVFNVLETIM